jgi:hypothetical protein
MMNGFRGSIALSIAIFQAIGHSAVAQTVMPSTSNTPVASDASPTPALVNEASVPGHTVQTADDVEAQILPDSDRFETTCPAGQFASAFPDVRPEHWAYEAVNRLAAVPIRCFPR